VTEVARQAGAMGAQDIVRWVTSACRNDPARTTLLISCSILEESA
jgi:hypothetical protein